MSGRHLPTAEATALPLRRRQRRITRPPAAQAQMPARHGHEDRADPESI